jgi:hypothetical protein
VVVLNHQAVHFPDLLLEHAMSCDWCVSYTASGRVAAPWAGSLLVCDFARQRGAWGPLEGAATGCDASSP